MGSQVDTYCDITPPVPPAMNFEYELILFGSPCPSSCARALFAASNDPNFMADSGMTFRTLRPLPRRVLA
jgi:hypothetical protein